jgi:lysophospholipase L1-like esterase
MPLRIVASATALLMCAASSPPVAAGNPTADQEAEASLHTDWAWLGRYREANAALVPARAPRIVLLGDSITQGWIDKVPAFFTPGRLDRGIGGQTSAQMLLRFRQDVIDLDPAVVQIMTGTNDIAGNTGPMTPAQTQANIMSMAELARAHGITVILASITPAANFPWRPGLATVPRIAELNAWLRQYAAQTGAIYADYWSALHDGDALRASLTYDGVHPNAAGYAAMAPVAEDAFRRALASRRRRR